MLRPMGEPGVGWGAGGQVQDAGGEALVGPGVHARRWPSCAGTRLGQGVVHSLLSLMGRLLIRVLCKGGRSHPDPPSSELCLPSTSPTHPVLLGGNGGGCLAGAESLGCLGGWGDGAWKIGEE